MDEPSFMYSENLTTDHINYFQTHILDIRGSMNIFDRVQSPSPSKNSMMINIPANSIDLVPTLPLNFGPSPINCIFERLIDDTNRRSVLKEKIESFSIQRDMQTADKFKSPKRMRRDQVDELYNRLLLDQKQRQEALNMRQVMRESPTRETSNVRISKQQEKEMLNRLQDYALQKKVWIEAMQEKKKRLEEAEIQRLKSSSSKRSRDPNLFERLSIPKTPSPLRKKRESPARTERSHTVQVINKTREAKKSTWSSKETLPESLESYEYKPTIQRLNLLKKLEVIGALTPRQESTRRTWHTARTSSISEENDSKVQFKIIDVDDYLKNLKSKIKREINTKTKNHHSDNGRSLARLFKLFPELENKMKISCKGN